jgi:apolipoprotein N-acyltransferase
VLLVLSFPKFGHPAFAWAALSPLITAAALSARPRSRWHHPFVLGLIAGLVYFGGTLYWVQSTMSLYGGLPAIVSTLVAALLASYLALYPALFATLTASALRRFGVGGLWLAPAFWVATEWLRGNLGAGFPWAVLGSSQATALPVAQAASVVGVYGLSAIVALVGTAAPVMAVSRRAIDRKICAGVALLLVLIVAGGALRMAGGRLTASGRVLRVGLIQGNVEQNEKWDPAFRDRILLRYLDLTRQAIGAGAQLIVWPESSTPFFFNVDSPLAAPVRRLAAETRTPMIIGTDEFEQGTAGAPDKYYNSAMLVGADGLSHGRYRKIRLVPFGEYVPLKRLLFFVGPLVESVSDFTPGTEAVVFDAGGARVSVAICYESIDPVLGRRFVANGSALLATITNDAWFGRSSAASQHFEQGALRAVEEGRYLVRAANTGISGAIDPYGRVIVRTALFEPKVVTVDVRLLDGRTIYSRVGDVVVWGSFALTAIAVVAGRRRRSVTPTKGPS